MGVFVEPIYVIVYLYLLGFGSFNNIIFRIFNCFISFIGDNFDQASATNCREEG